MNASSVGSSTALQNPLIIRMSYPRPLIDRKPDDEASRIVIGGGAQPSSSLSATVPQIISINPVISAVAAAGSAVTKKCTFHASLLQSPQQQAGQQQQAPVSQHTQHHTIQLPLQTPPQLLHHHPQLLQHAQNVQQQQIGNNQIPIPASNSSTSAAAAVNRSSAQPNRDAISTNITPQFNAALLQDRYLLLDLVDGSSFHKVIDIRTQKMLVCKVRR